MADEIAISLDLIIKCADAMKDMDWSDIELILDKFSFPNLSSFSGDTRSYVISRIRDSEHSRILDLAKYFNVYNDGTDEPIISDLLNVLQEQKDLMVDVATGRLRIDEVNDLYRERRGKILEILSAINKQDPNPFSDLWEWYKHWKKDLPTYQSRRDYIIELYQPLIETLTNIQLGIKDKSNIPKTGWENVDRMITKVEVEFSTAKSEEDFQGIGLLIREILISIGQEVYCRELDTNESPPSKTDAKELINRFLSSSFSGGSNEELRRFVKDVYDLSVALQHKRERNKLHAEINVEATKLFIKIIKILIRYQNET